MATPRKRYKSDCTLSKLYRNDFEPESESEIEADDEEELSTDTDDSENPDLSLSDGEGNGDGDEPSSEVFQRAMARHEALLGSNEFESENIRILRIEQEESDDKTDDGEDIRNGNVATKHETEAQVRPSSGNSKRSSLKFKVVLSTPRRYRGYRYIPTLDQYRPVPNGNGDNERRGLLRRRRDMRVLTLKREYFKKYLRYKALKIQYDKYVRQEKIRRRKLALRKCIRLLMAAFTIILAGGIVLELWDIACMLPGFIFQILTMTRGPGGHDA